MPYKKSSYASGRRYRRPYAYGRGDYGVARYGQPRMVGRGDYKKVYQKIAHGFSAPKVGSAIGRSLALAAAPVASKYLGPAIAAEIPSLGASVGKALGKGFKSITGMGDYTVHQNSLLFPDQVVPSFGSDDTIRVKKREFIAQIDAYQSFTNLSIPIQPGLDTSFPWLSRIAANYEQYHFNGLIFQFVSTSSDAIASTTDLGLGSVALATDYDALDRPFVNLPQMLGSMFSNSGKPSENIMHAIECAPNDQAQKLYYVRTGDIPANADARLYDLGNFQIATDRMPADYDGCGQLWVSYDITFTKSVQNNQLGFDINTDHFQLQTVTNAAPLGSVDAVVKSGSNLGCTIQPSVDTLLFPPNLASGYYMLTYIVSGSSTLVASPTFTFNNCTQVTNEWAGDTLALITNTGTTTSRYIATMYVRLNSNNANIVFGAAGTLPASATSGDLIVTQVNGELFV